MAAAEEPSLALASSPKPNTPGNRVEQHDPSVEVAQSVGGEEQKTKSGNKKNGIHGGKKTDQGDNWESLGQNQKQQQ